MKGLLGEDVKVTQVIDATAGAAGTTDINGDSVDMNGYEGVMFILVLGAITANAVTSLKAQQSSDDGSVDTFADLEGTGMTIADSDDEQVFILDIWKPQEQYVRPVVDRATQNAVVQTCLAVQYKARETPITQSVTDLVTYENHVSPDEGTA